MLTLLHPSRGWGAFCDGQRARGRWNPEEQNLHINVLELMAAFFALRCFADKLRDCSILLRIDNTAAVSYINRMGGVKFQNLNHVSRLIWCWCEHRNLFVFASYIPSSQNIEADSESRVPRHDTEFALNSELFTLINLLDLRLSTSSLTVIILSVPGLLHGTETRPR